MNFTYFMPAKVHFGPGCLKELGEVKLGEKALIVTTGGKSVKKYGYLDRVIEELQRAGAGYVLFDKVLANPVKRHVEEGAKLARESGCDFVVGLGGGSSIDTAKSIAIMANNPGDYWDYLDGGSGKGLPIPNDPLPVVAITTTAGTGTEADPWTVITDEERREKLGFGYEKSFPTVSFVDPELMVTVPPHLTAFQGFDALFHSMEGYIATIANPMSDLFALKSIELLGKYLPAAVENGQNLEARTQVALANTLAGLVESTSSCTSEHALEHLMSAHHPQLPHGAGLIMISLEYFRLYAPAREERYVEMARALGFQDASAPEDLLTALRELQVSCRVADLKMSDYGIQIDELPMFAREAMSQMAGSFELDPFAMTEEQAIEIYTRSYR